MAVACSVAVTIGAGIVFADIATVIWEWKVRGGDAMAGVYEPCRGGARRLDEVSEVFHAQGSRGLDPASYAWHNVCETLLFGIGVNIKPLSVLMHLNIKHEEPQ